MRGAGAQEELVTTAPARFSGRPMSVAAAGWGVYLDVDDVEGDGIDEIVLDAYRVIAPGKLTALLD